MKKIILYFLVSSIGYSYQMNMKLGSKVSNLTDIGLGGDSIFDFEFLNFDFKIKNDISVLKLNTNLSYKEPTYSTTNLRFNLDPYFDIDFSFLKVGLSSYKDRTFYRRNPKDYLLVIQNKFKKMNLFLFMMPNFPFSNKEYTGDISLTYGLQKEKTNEFKLIVYDFKLRAKRNFDFAEMSIVVSLGRAERFETIKQLNLSGLVNLLDSFKIYSQIETEDFFSARIKQKFPMARGPKNFSLILKEEIYYKRGKDDLHQFTCVGSAGFISKNEIPDFFYFDMEFRIDFVHFWHSQENRVWFFLELDFGYLFSKVK